MKFTILIISVSVIYAISEVQTTPVSKADSKDQSLKGQGPLFGGQDPKPDGQEQSSQSSNNLTSTPKVKRTYKKIYPKFKPRLFEGDIVIDENKDKNAVLDYQRWPGGVIYYVVNSDISVDIENHLINAMDELTEKTCIRFLPRTTQPDYVFIYSGEGCMAHMGRKGGEQILSVNNIQCNNYGIVIHELLHAVGFVHEHSRSDRDDYLIINWENIQKEQYYNFKKVEPDQEQLFTAFEYNSVMLYGPSAFSMGTGTTHPTMSAKEEGVVLKEVWDKVPSESDFKRVNMLYECPEK